MTLFSGVQGASPEFGSAIDRFFAGEPDEATLRLLRDKAFAAGSSR